MTDRWYDQVPADAGILQGDLILKCPLLVWKVEAASHEDLKGLWEIVASDVVVMTQACDLEQRKVTEVVVCSTYTLDEAKKLWLKTQHQTAGDKAWKGQFEKMNSGFVWNFAVLNRGEADGLSTVHRVVDFHGISTVPLSYLEAIASKGGPRLRLRPPYREHLSQSFARYFMRVGLPTPVDSPW